MMRRFVISLTFLLMSLAAFCTKYQIVKLSTPTIKIGSETCKENSVFDSSAHIHWSGKKQGMWVRDLEKGKYYYFSAEAFLARKSKSAFEYISSKKASTRDVGFSKVVSRTSEDDEFEKRIALVIGNSNYTAEKSLCTPIPDAIVVSETLSEIGFNVYVLFDADKQQMDEAIKKFSGFASNYETALVYYAGHGTQFNNKLYLIPVDAVVETSSDVNDRCMAAHRLVSFLNDVQSLKTRLLFIDACRTENNLLASRGGNSDEFSTDELKDGIIVYSTKQGYVAYDETAESFSHSPFTQAFVDNVIKTNISVNDFITDLMSEVKLLTSSAPYPFPQEPRFIPTLARRFYFRPSAKTSSDPVLQYRAERKNKTEESKESTSSFDINASSHPQTPEEMCNVGMKYYDEGKYHEAAEWFEKAANQGFAQAQHNLGACYAKGRGVGQSYEKAVYWYEKAANQGSSAAQNNLGVCYENGRGVGQSYEKAVYWYEKAANQGFAQAQCNLGFCYENGQGVGQSYEKAVYWYEKAANQGFAQAQCNLGFCYENGKGVGQSYEKAVFWYEKAANQGYARAKNNLGVCYAEGQGVVQSYEKAVYWYEKAANQGYARAQCNLGFCYENGQGVGQSYEKAAYWFEKAANQGIAVAQFKLGLCYELGWGVKKDLQKAKFWKDKSGIK